MPPRSSLNLENGLDNKTAEGFIYAGSPHETGTSNHRHSPDEFLEIPSSAGLPPGIDWGKEGLFHGQESYSSFGEKGTTASINAYGNILQISKYLGAGTSGIFCADPCILEPWFLRYRLDQLLDLSTNPEGGFGLCLNPQLVSSKPRLQFLHNRWPRYTHKIGNLSMSISYFANHGAIIQQYSFQRAQGNETKKHVEGTDAYTPQSAEDDIIQDVNENSATAIQIERHQMQANSAQDDRKRNDQSSGDRTQGGQVGKKQAQGIILPQYEAQRSKTFSDVQKKVSVKDCLRLKTRLQIRESDWANSSNNFNIDEPEHSRYQTSLGQNGYSLVVNHQLPNTIKTSKAMLDTYEAVALVIAVFVNGRATKIAKTRNVNGSGTYEIQIDPADARKLDEGLESKINTTLEITVAYDLRLMEKDHSWKSTLIQASVLDLDDLMLQNSYDPKLSLSTSVHLDFIMKRHLEHILSVCSIPVKPRRAETRKSQGDSLVALTCGDISGHHVFISASFFEFQFLLKMYSHSKISHDSKLAERIFQTLKGHLEWVFLHTEKKLYDSDQLFGGYWANGQGVSCLREHRTLQHTPLQIIKARDFASMFGNRGKVPGWFVKEVGDFVQNWIWSLRENDDRDHCVFSRISDWDHDESYYLRDHVLIWKALGITDVLEDLQSPRGFNGFSRELRTYFNEKKKRSTSLGIYTSEQARRCILKRFTTQNIITNERMVAIYRDAQKNSFLLDAMDTILFYDEQQFFHDNSKKAVFSKSHDGRKTGLDEWARTLDVQTRHEKPDGNDWHEPLRYALAIQLGEQGRQIDSRPAGDILDEGLKVLLQSCSTSGIFPGFLRRGTKPSVIFNENLEFRLSDWHSYWHASFELPYIIWMHAKKRLEETRGRDEKEATREKPAAASQEETNRKTQSQRDQRKSDHKLIPAMVPAKTALMGQDFIDQKNILEISDEWLTHRPEFLHFDIGRSLKVLEMIGSLQTNLVAESRWLIVDIPKRRYQRDERTLVDPQPRTNKEFFDRLQQWRTKESNMLIKKRIVWTSSDDQEAAEMCPATVPYSEQLALRNFFGRHKSRQKYFLDDPSARDNSWKTEFQLSFYQLGKQEHGHHPKPEIALAKRIRQGSMGFRFNGDFFDCYWVCHVISPSSRENKGKEENPEHQTNRLNEDVEILLNNRLSGKNGVSARIVTEDGPEKREWYQRRVLELILFEEVIRKVTTGTQEILAEISNVLTSPTQFGLHSNETDGDLPDKVKETVLFSKIDGNAYFSFSAQWEVLQQLLQVLDEDLSDTVKRIHTWRIREESRGKETPRWTRKDEKRYRPALRRMQLSNAESVRELQQLQEKVQSLRSSLINRRDYIRDDLNLRGAENTRYFTYVTVVFLPLGFATGIFSMSEAPAGSTLARMSGTAAITVLMTVIALYFVVDLLEAFKSCCAASAKPLGRVKEDLEQLLQRANDVLKQFLHLVEGLLKRIFPPLFITYVLLRALGEFMASMFSKLWATSARFVERVKKELERLLLPLLFAYVLWNVLGGSLSNVLNGQDRPSPRGSNDGDTDWRDSTAYLPEGSPQGQPAKQKRSASRSGDLENQVGCSHSFR